MRQGGVLEDDESDEMSFAQTSDKTGKAHIQWEEIEAYDRCCGMPSDKVSNGMLSIICSYAPESLVSGKSWMQGSGEGCCESVFDNSVAAYPTCPRGVFRCRGKITFRAFVQ